MLCMALQAPCIGLFRLRQRTPDSFTSRTPLLRSMARSRREAKSWPFMLVVAVAAELRMAVLRRCLGRPHPSAHRLSMVAIDRHQKLKWLDVRRDLKSLAICYRLVFHLRKVGHLPKPPLVYF